MAKMWVPQPATKLYGGNAEAVRDRLVREFGEASVMKAEVSVVLDLMMINRLIAPQEFMTVMEHKLKRIDDMRRDIARLESDHR